MHAATVKAAPHQTNNVRPSSSRRDRRVSAQDRLLLGATCILLCVTFISGGSSQETNAGMLIARLLAIPVTMLALWEAQRRGVTGHARWSLVTLACVVSIPLLQLLPLPEWLWMSAPARQQLQNDLAAAGVSNIHYRWSLSPAATERDLLSLLPSAALFVCAVTLGKEAHRRLCWLVIALALFSVAFAVVQMGAGEQSILNLYPQWVPAMGGIFANPNHQAASVAIALVLAISMLLDSRSRVRRGEPVRELVWIFAVLIVMFALTVPMIGSRAGPILAMISAVIVALGSGAFPIARVRGHRGTQAFLCLAAVVLLLGVYAAFNWTAGAKIDVIRSTLTRQTALIGYTHAPLGGGYGGFVPLFDQGVDNSLIGGEYINNAHNDYVQLWLEGGVAAIAGMLAVLVWLAVSFLRLLALHPKSGSRRRGFAAATAMFVIVLHSWVDYPLRTPALMAVFALLAGVFSGSVAMGRATSSATHSAHGEKSSLRVKASGINASPHA